MSSKQQLSCCYNKDEWDTKQWYAQGDQQDQASHRFHEHPEENIEGRVVSEQHIKGLFLRK